MQRQVLPALVRLAGELEIPLVCTNDCHYIDREDADVHEVFRFLDRRDAAGQMEFLGVARELPRMDAEHVKMHEDSDQFYLKSGSEMLVLFHDHPDAVARSGEIARRCQVELDFSTDHTPKFPLPEGETNNFAYLEKLCEEGIARLCGPDRADVRARRMAYLKLHYPVEFMAARLNSVDPFDDQQEFVRSMRRQHTAVLLPVEGGSKDRCCVGWKNGRKTVRLSLNAVGFLGRDAVRQLAGERE